MPKPSVEAIAGFMGFKDEEETVKETKVEPQESKPSVKSTKKKKQTSTKTKEEPSREKYKRRHKVTISASIDSELAESFISHCKKNDYNKSQIIEEFITEFMNGETK